MDNRPIGVFDSGLGGLTVLDKIIELLKNESIVYFGDSGRYPYGTKSKDTIIKYSFQNVRFLLNQDVKMIVVACNTASACSLEAIKKNFDIPIVEVVGPGAATAVKETRNNKIGVIGTSATINSSVYETAIKKINSSVEVYQKACPLFVPLVEEGWWDNEIAHKVAIEYLTPLLKEDIDTAVLGCTHYPLLHKTISRVMGDNVKLVSSALEIAKVVKQFITEFDMLRDENIPPVYRYYTSDSADKFEDLGSVILNNRIYSVQKVDIEKY